MSLTHTAAPTPPVPPVPAPSLRRMPGQVVLLHVRPATARPATAPAPAPGGAQVLPLFAARPLPPGPHAAVCFSTQDRMALLSWHTAGSGYVRLAVEDGQPGDAPDRGAFALAYRAGQPFATLGLTRTPAGIQSWRCADGEVLGMHATMAAALAALAPA